MEIHATIKKAKLIPFASATKPRTRGHKNLPNLLKNDNTHVISPRLSCGTIAVAIPSTAGLISANDREINMLRIAMR